MIRIDPARRKTYLRTSRALVVVSVATGLFYLKWLLFDARPDNAVLFGMLITAELFNLVQASGFWFTIFRQTWTDPPPADFSRGYETVDVFITVCGEPIEIVDKTIRGALGIRHPRKTVWVLDDGHSNEVELECALLGARYLTRTDRAGAKAGNINRAMGRTRGDYILILDADHIPRPEFLERTLGGFSDARVAFVQTPQSYRNRDTNRVAGGAHDQQQLFYGPIMRGKNAWGGVFSCGTNVVFRRSALEALGGMPEDSITEDLRVSLMLSKQGMRGAYVAEELAEGLGPLDVSGFFGQQMRWARGGLEILFKRKPYHGGMRPTEAAQYSLGFIYWFTGWAYTTYLLLPVAYLLFGVRPVQVPNQYPVYFLPYIFTTLITLAYAADLKLTFRGLWFTLASFPVYIVAFVSALLGRDARFVVTAKEGSVRSLRPVSVHVAVVALLLFSIAWGIATKGFNASVMNNVAFALGHILIVQGFIRYSLDPEADIEREPLRDREATS